jgi:hypothetical protein
MTRPAIALLLFAAALSTAGCTRCRKGSPPAPVDDAEDGGGDASAAVPENQTPVRVVTADGVQHHIYEQMNPPPDPADVEGFAPVRAEFACPRQEQLEPTLPDPQPGFSMETLRGFFPDMPRAEIPVSINTEAGMIECVVWADAAPQAAALFLGLATGARAWWHPCRHEWVSGRPYYDELTFQKVEPAVYVESGCLDHRCQSGAGIATGITDRGGGFDRPGLLIMAREGPAGRFGIVDCRWDAPEPTKLTEGECRLEAEATRLQQDWVAFGACGHTGLGHTVYRLARVVPDRHLDPRALHWLRAAAPDGTFYRHRTTPPDGEEGPQTTEGPPPGTQGDPGGTPATPGTVTTPPAEGTATAVTGTAVTGTPGGAPTTTIAPVQPAP